MANNKPKKQEALSVSRLINEVLVNQLSIPFRQIVNDTTFSKYTGSKRPDILISEFEYDGSNDTQYIENLVAYAEAKDDCVVGDKDWKDAIKQGITKSKKLKLPYFIVTNCKKTIFYNATNLKEISLNGNPIREFQTIDIFRLIKNRLTKDPELTNILTNVDSISTISEAIFNKKLWELANIYRGINFKDNVQKIDFTIGFIALEYFEEKQKIDNRIDNSLMYWSGCLDNNEKNETLKETKLVGNLSQYIANLEQETSFGEFKNLMDVVYDLINGINGEKPLIGKSNVKLIYDTIDSMKPLHGTGFDLFGAVYEMFANAKEKKDFGEYFTRRHYTHIFAKLLLQNEQFFNQNHKFNILDPACGTGGFLTESFKVLKNNWEKSGTLNKDAIKFLSEECFYGIDVRGENISRTRLNMFLVGDGHTNMYDDNSLKPLKKITSDLLDKKKYQYIITNPPYGNGTIKAKTTSLSSTRCEVAFLFRIIELLEVGGRSCIIIPDGVLENPTLKELRKELLEKCNIDAIISLPKFAFAPYTKEKTYAVFITKRSDKSTKIQSKPIWMYIIDNDGLANSDKRFPTKLRNNRNGWMHDEISGWVSTGGEEMPGLLESRWLTFDDKDTKGTEWINEKGEICRFRKGGNINIKDIANDKYCTLLPEYYLRPYDPEYTTFEENKELSINILNSLKIKFKNVTNDSLKVIEHPYQAYSEPINKVLKYMSGNSGLTEDIIYQSIKINGEKYKILSSSTEDDTSMGEISKIKIKGKDLKVFKDKEGLLVTRNGKAGYTKFLPKGNYTINDHAYILYKNEECKYKINLQWLAIAYRKTFLEYASNSDNGTWNMTGFFEHVCIDIPSIEEQNVIAEKYHKIMTLQESLYKAQSDLKTLLNKEIIL